MATKTWKQILHSIALVALIVPSVFLANPVSGAETIDQLKDKINGHNDRISQLEKEIAQYEAEIAKTGKEAKTLQGEIARLSAERKKLLKEISLTETQISTVGLTIDQLGLEISSKEEKIGLNLSAIASVIKRMDQNEMRSTLEIVLTDESIADALNHVDALEQFEKSIQSRLQALRSLKSELQDKKTDNETKKRELESLKDRYGDQKQLTEINKSEKDRLLAVTKNQEAKYKEELAERKRLKEQFEKEILALESAIKIAIDPSSIPTAGTSVLAWPLSSILITQNFGTTEFSKANPGVYNGNGHNGIDLRAPNYTPVMAAASGEVQGTGNTDLQKGCYSYGKWVLIKHPSGLSTLYAHLSKIDVTTGQEVNVGEIIGYSGNTGYSTGPHLHFTVYASQGVKIERFSRSSNCKNVDIPVAALNAYLNPLSYLSEPR